MNQSYTDNIFTKIIKGEIPCKKIFENDQCIAFHDINPRAPIHALVLPKQNIINFTDFMNQNKQNSIFIGEFFQTVNKIATEELNLKDFQIIANNGKQAGQEIFHFHVHIKGYK